MGLHDAGDEPADAEDDLPYDYIMLIFLNGGDLQQACKVLGIQKAQIEYPGGLQKVSLGRCVMGR